MTKLLADGGDNAGIDQPLQSSPLSTKTRPRKALPTTRIAFSKQLDILRAYAAASGPTRKSVTNSDIEDIIKMKASTISLGNAFFDDTGLLQRTDKGFVPSQELMNFHRAYEWAPDNAAQKLAPLIEKTWFAQELLPKLSFGVISEQEAISDLADAAHASPEHEHQLQFLLEYLAAAGLIIKDGGQVRIARQSPSAEKSTAQPTATEREPAQQSSRSSVATAFMQPTEGTVQFHISVKVDMKEFSGWQADRIAAFFSGIAQVLAAKGEIERDASDR